MNVSDESARAVINQCVPPRFVIVAAVGFLVTWAVVENVQRTQFSSGKVEPESRYKFWNELELVMKQKELVQQLNFKPKSYSLTSMSNEGVREQNVIRNVVETRPNQVADNQLIVSKKITRNMEEDVVPLAKSKKGSSKGSKEGGKKTLKDKDPKRKNHLKTNTVSKSSKESSKKSKGKTKKEKDDNKMKIAKEGRSKKKSKKEKIIPTSMVYDTNSTTSNTIATIPAGDDDDSRVAKEIKKFSRFNIWKILATGG